MSMPAMRAARVIAAQRAACFFEDDPGLALGRRALAEGVGTLLLTIAAVGAGAASAQAFAELPGMALLVTAIAIAAALVGLILALGKVSGGHFNPLITALQWLAGERTISCTIAYVVAQGIGAIAGALLAQVLYPEAIASPPVGPVGFDLIFSELVASVGLMLVVFGCSRSGRIETGPFAVGAWLTAAIIATPSGSLANPAIALAAVLATGPLHLGPAMAGWFVVVELVGAVIALGLVQILYPVTEPDHDPIRLDDPAEQRRI